MIIQCNQCERKFRVDDSKIKPPGSRVRCSKCGNVFFVEIKEQLKTDQPDPDNLKIDSEVKISKEKSFAQYDISADSDSSRNDRSSSEVYIEDPKKDVVWSIDEKDTATPKEYIEKGITPDIETEVVKEPIKEPEIEAPQSNGSISTETKSSDSEFQLDSLNVSDNKQELSTEKLETAVSDSSDTIEQQEVSVNSKSIETNVQYDKSNEQSVSTTSSPAIEDRQEIETSQQLDLSAIQLDEKDLKLDVVKDEEMDNLSGTSQEPAAEPSSSSLSVDQQALSQIKAESYGTPIASSQDFSSSEHAVTKSTYVPKRTSVGSKIGALLVRTLVAVSILVIITSAFIIISVNLGILPKEKTQELRKFIIANLPIKIKDPLDGIEVTEVQGKWVTSSNGTIFILTGNITNYSDNIVNYIKIKTEFSTNGELLYDKNIYAGNTFTEKELQTLSLNDILIKLNRKNGDIDFANPRKLAGKNYNIMPGESVEFYSVFPAESKILGLKYDVEIVDAEIIVIDKSA